MPALDDEHGRFPRRRFTRSDTDSFTYSHAYTCTRPHSQAHAHTYPSAYAYAQAHPNTYAQADSDSYPDARPGTDPNPDLQRLLRLERRCRHQQRQHQHRRLQIACRFFQRQLHPDH